MVYIYWVNILVIWFISGSCNLSCILSNIEYIYCIKIKVEKLFNSVIY